MKVLANKVNKIMQIASWGHLSEEERKAKIEQVLSEAYDLGHADGYAEGHCNGYNLGKDVGYREGFADGW